MGVVALFEAKRAVILAKRHAFFDL